MFKTEHELWVRSQLGEAEVDPERLVAQQVYAALIDGATTAARFADWYNWTSWALAPEPQWKENHLEAIQQLRRTVFAAIWPAKHPELEIALQHFSLVLSKAARTFREHGEIDGNIVRADMFYRRANSEVLYNERHDAFMGWIKECHELIFEATKAANWLADCVRKYVNPMFYALEGKFIVAYESGFNVSDLRPEYSIQERERLITQYQGLSGRK
ncbi:MAG: hypothetical protein JO093_22925 [Acidobacteria bacterium]|nr:hypothetical protein [Acidobacteriota bacterium]MBV9188481.1 hypothetical protein [Acidobacteriota bacterium]